MSIAVKSVRSILVFGFISLLLIPSIVRGQTYYPINHSSNCRGFYIGVFGGLTWANSTNFRQSSVAFLSDGPLFVNAHGRTHANTNGMGGIQVGYQWNRENSGCCSCLEKVIPTIEFEAFYLRNRLEGRLFNSTPLIPGHTFFTKLPMDSGVFLGNAVFSFNLNRFQPYVGGGIGIARMHISEADAAQIIPFEPGVNHFNSNPSSSDWALAAQGKAGLGYQVCNCWKIFAEYRLLYLTSTSYIFGATDFPGHSFTTHWVVNLKRVFNNMFVIGISYSP